jgi:cytochrome c oxidase assembly protein subunit 15
VKSSFQTNWLKHYAVFTALATFVLVCIGGLVTSHEAGLTVPDWPTSCGYNMFFFPISKWVGGIFFEHLHRLAASGVGLLTTILMVWLLKSRTAPKWLRILGVIAFFGVVAQGVLGGLRVILLKDQLGVFHAALAQLFLVLMCAIALFQTDFWRNLPIHAETDAHRFRPLFIFTTALVFCQLVLGATMRHQHAGLSIPDFPAAYGKIWPATDPASISRYNQNRLEVIGYNPITAFQVELQMVHRLVALLIFGAVGITCWRASRLLGLGHLLTRFTYAWSGLVMVQIFLGAATIWTGKSADIATAHVACGALCLVTGSLASIVACRLLAARNQSCVNTAPNRVAKNELATLLPSSSISKS